MIAHGVQEVGEPANGDGRLTALRRSFPERLAHRDRGLGDIVRVQIVFEYPDQVVDAQLVERIAHLIDADPAVVDIQPGTRAVGQPRDTVPDPPPPRWCAATRPPKPLGEGRDRNPLILPANISLDDPRVRFELTRYLLEN